MVRVGAITRLGQRWAYVAARKHLGSMFVVAHLAARVGVPHVGRHAEARAARASTGEHGGAIPAAALVLLTAAVRGVDGQAGVRVGPVLEIPVR